MNDRPLFLAGKIRKKEITRRNSTEVKKVIYDELGNINSTKSNLIKITKYNNVIEIEKINHNSLMITYDKNHNVTEIK